MNNLKQQQRMLASNPSRQYRSSIKSRFTRRFLRALIRMKKRNYQPCSSSSSSGREFFRRYRRVKIAADKSMAVAVGSRRAWSRAMLWKIHHHHQTWRYRPFMTKRNHTCYNQPIKKRLVIEKKQQKKKMTKKEEGDHHHHHQQQQQEEDQGGFREAKELRKLVPGGETMDLCNLLDETAHYIKCLVTQVQVMRSIDEFYST